MNIYMDDENIIPIDKIVHAVIRLGGSVEVYLEGKERRIMLDDDNAKYFIKYMSFLAVKDK